MTQEDFAAALAAAGVKVPRKRSAKPSFSKKLVFFNGILLGFVTAAAMVFAWCGKDTSIFAYILPSVYGEFAACCVSYSIKAAKENTEGGIVYEQAMHGLGALPEPQPQPPPRPRSRKPKTPVDGQMEMEGQ